MIGSIILKAALEKTGAKSMNLRDVDTMMKTWAHDAVLIYPGNMPFSGKIAGKPMLTAFFETYMEQFPVMEFEVTNTFIDRMFSIGMTNTLATVTNINYTNRFGKSFENTSMSILDIKNGKLVYDKDFYHDVDMLNEAWEGVDLHLLEPFLEN